MHVNSVLSDMDDLTGKARALEPLWYIKDKIVVKEQKRQELLQRNHAFVKTGDFVNVTAVLQIDVKPPMNRPRIRINLVMKEVVVLESKSPVSALKETNEDSFFLTSATDIH